MSTATIRSSRPVNQPAPGKRLSLSDAISGGKQLPSRVIFHGQSGIGKTSFAANAPKPFFLLSRGETGLHTLIDSGQLPKIQNVEAKTWDDCMGILDDLTSQPHDYKTLVIDVLDGMEKLANEYVCATSFNNDWGRTGFVNYSAGERAVASCQTRELICALEKLREVKRMAIIGLAHTGVGNFNNPLGSDYNRYLPSIYKDSWNLLEAWADIVLYGYHEVVAAKNKEDRKAKATTGVRLMATEWCAAFSAKNRHGLPPEIEMGGSGQEAWNNFKTALEAGRKAKVTNG